MRVPGFVTLLLPLCATCADPSNTPASDAASLEIDGGRLDAQTESPDASAPSADAFAAWAAAREITLQGVSKSANELYFEGYDPDTDAVPWSEVPGFLVVAAALTPIDEGALEPLRGKTLYFSTETGRSYTVIAPGDTVLVNVARGVVYEQPISAHTVVHEAGHIIDFHGIQGLYDDPQDIFAEHLTERDQVFEVEVEYDPNLTSAPPGYLSNYATANDAENFAEHLAYYVRDGAEFRDRAAEDGLLADKYIFLRDRIFGLTEY